MVPAVLLAAVAAAMSIRSGETTTRIVGSGWFMSLAGGVFLLTLLAALRAVVRRPAGWLAILAVHLGLAAGLAGVGLNQLDTDSGYLLLEAGAGQQDFFLDRNRREVRPLPFPVQLDSVTDVARRGFQPALQAWVSARQTGSTPVAYNQPLRLAGFSLLLLRPVEPGTPLEVKLSLDGTDYLLVHNQHAQIADGRMVWSHGYDARTQALTLVVEDTLVELSASDSLHVRGVSIVLKSFRLTRRPGAVFALRLSRLRPLIFAGFGLMLLGTAGLLLTKETA